MATHSNGARPRVNGYFTNWVPITSLRHNSLNAEVYGEEYLSENSKYIAELAESILDNGLDHAVEVCSDGVTLIGGHHRTDACTDLGYSEMPVIVTDFEEADFKDAKSKLDMMNLLVRNNMQNSYTQWQRWNQAERWIAVYNEEHGQDPSSTEFNKQFGRSIGFMYATLEQARQVEKGYTWRNKKNLKGLPNVLQVGPRPDLLENVRGWYIDKVDGKKKYFAKTRSFKSAFDTQLSDAKAKARLVSYPMLKEHTDLDIDEAVIESIKEAGRWIRGLMNQTTTFCGQDILLGDVQDKSTLSGMFHGGVTKLLPTALGNFDIGEKDVHIKATAPDDGAHFDITALPQQATNMKKWELEVKCNAGTKQNWTSSTDKIGYGLFMRANETFTKVFAAYVYIPEKYPLVSEKDLSYEAKPCWTGGGAVKTKKLSKNCLYRLLKGLDQQFPKRFDIPTEELKPKEWMDEFPSHGRVILGDIREFTNGNKSSVEIELESIVD